MNIAIMSHTKKQDLMVQFCTAYCGVLSKHSVCATNATGRMVADATGLPVHLFLSHEHGGIEQIGQRIIYNEIDMVLFFNSPLDNEMDKDVLYISRLCDQHSVPMATNVATAELLIHGLARGDLDWGGHEPQPGALCAVSFSGGLWPPALSVTAPPCQLPLWGSQVGADVLIRPR